MEPSVIWNNIVEMLKFSPESPMVFSSGLFWALFIVFLPIYAMLKSHRTKMLVFVVAFSLFFYYKSSGMYFLLLVGTSLFDWHLSRILVKQKKIFMRKLCVLLSLIASLGILCYFKYSNFIL